jgi:orotidine-5'-phosphate decarboxylase
MTLPFAQKLAEAVKRNSSLVCVGLDPDPNLMPMEDVAEFNKAIINATYDLVCAYKPNLAFFEALGDEGWRALKETLAAIPEDVPVIIDAKRGDIGNTAQAYAHAVFDVLGADAMTVNAYGGKDAVEPFLEHADRGILIWCRSSNPSAVDFQDLEVDFKGEHMPLWQAVATEAAAWNTRGNVGLVMGATYPEQLGKARELAPTMPILVPGIGAQEGSARAVVEAGLNADRTGIIVNASRSIIYASRDDDFALAARSATAQLREQINRYTWR